MAKWRSIVIGAMLLLITSVGAGAASAADHSVIEPALIRVAELSASDAQLKTHFDYLSRNGNSTCSRAFMESIASMPDDVRLQGSCCSPMSFHRYSEQLEGLKNYDQIAEIPSNPYDVPAGIAKRLLAYYDLELTAEEEEAYDYAMKNSDEKGPCCCPCWRWNTYGGLGKFLIRDHGFTGQQVAEVWDLSDGCGGEGDHVH